MIQWHIHVFSCRHATLYEALSVHPLVCRSVCRSIMVIKLKIVKRRIFEAPDVTVCASVCGVGEGVNGDCTPMPTRPQQSCDPVSPLIYLPLSFPQTV